MGFLSRDAIELGALFAQVQAADRGGIACFVGTVRNHHDGRQVQGLDYHAYQPMVEAECARIVAETESRWQVRVTLRHRIGRLEVGDTAVAVLAASAHRDEAFVACRHVIEELKRRVPIWKREAFTDGGVEWVDPTRTSGAEDRRMLRQAEGHSSERLSRAVGEAT